LMAGAVARKDDRAAAAPRTIDAAEQLPGTPLARRALRNRPTAAASRTAEAPARGPARSRDALQWAAAAIALASLSSPAPDSRSPGIAEHSRDRNRHRTLARDQECVGRPAACALADQRSRPRL